MGASPTRRSASLRSVLSALFGLAGLLAGAWATWLNLNAAQAAEPTPSPTTASATSDLLPPVVNLPPFQPSRPDPLVSRRANLYTILPSRPRVDVLRYTVQQGDSVFGIADRFGLQPETVLWGNYEVLKDDPHKLRPGQELNILPVDGTYYRWHAGDSVLAVADFFGVEPQEILDWPGNHVDPIGPDIAPNTWVVVPGGRRAFRQWFVPTIARGRAGVGTAYGPGGCTGDYTSGAVGTGGFIWPSANHYVSGNDYWAGHLAIDIAAGEGEPVWAADGGVAVFAGWSTGGYGYMLMLDHGNGWQTVYAHLSQVGIGCGQSVSQGQVIGRAGSSGNSTGPHLHLETRFDGGFVNPWYVLP